MKQGFTYILTNKRNGTLYIGVTSNIERRMYEHKLGIIDGFSKRYATTKLVHLEQFDHIEDAIAREKKLKKWNRCWKLELIENQNPDWVDLAIELNPQSHQRNE